MHGAEVAFEDEAIPIKNKERLRDIKKQGSEVSIYRAQLFTSLKADLRQDMNRVSSFSRCLNGTFP